MNLLWSTDNFFDDWCYHRLAPLVPPSSRVAVVALSFYEQFTHTLADWQALYRPDGGMFYSSVVGNLTVFGIAERDIEWIHYFEDSPQTAQQKIQRAEILYFTGGAPDQMYRRIKELDLLDAIRRHGGLKMGLSAGAMVQLDRYHISPDADYPEFLWAEGCGLVGGFDLEVHYTGSKEQEEAIARSLRERSLPVYALTDRSGLIVDESGVPEILGEAVCFTP